MQDVARMEIVRSKPKVYVVSAEHGTRAQNNGYVLSVSNYNFVDRLLLDVMNAYVSSVIVTMLNIQNTRAFMECLGLCVQIVQFLFLLNINKCGCGYYFLHALYFLCICGALFPFLKNRTVIHVEKVKIVR
jgi:hypothetical protein